MLNYKQLEQDEINNNEFEISEFFVSRKCNLSYATLNGLRCSMIATYVDLLGQLQLKKSALVDSSSEYIYEKIQEVADEDKKYFIQLRRDIYNDRQFSKKALTIVKKYHEKTIIRWINEIRQINEIIDKTMAEFDSHLESYYISARKHIVKVCANADFMKGLQLSEKRLCEQTEYYKKAIEENINLNKKLKKFEETLVNFVSRACTKPSPFASFTTITTHLDECDSDKLNAEYRLCLLSRGVIDYILFRFCQNEKLNIFLPIRLNTTITITNHSVTFLSTVNNSDIVNYNNEKFVTLKSSDMINQIIRLLNARRYTKSDLIAEFRDMHYPKSDIETFINKLFDIGFIQYYFPVSTSATDYVKKISSFLCKLEQTPEISKLVCLLRRLSQIENIFSTANLDYRKQAIISIENTVLEIFAVLNIKDSLIKNAKNYIYEDVGRITDDAKKIAASLNPYHTDLATVGKLMYLFDQSSIERLAIYDYFKAMYPRQGQQVSFIQFYKQFAQRDISELVKIMSGQFSAKAAILKQGRNEVMQHIGKLLNNHNDKDEPLFLSKTDLTQLIEQYICIPFNNLSMIYYVNNSRDGAFINGVSMGYGSLYSRFCNIYQDDIEFITKKLKMTFAAKSHADDMYDIAAVLGLNTNLHPNILAKTIEYPDTFVNPNHEISEVLHLNQLIVEAKDSENILILKNINTNHEIHFNPLNFLFPAAGPNLYRILYLFAPYINYSHGFWRHYLTEYNLDQHDKLPRLMLGKLVIDRKTWLLDNPTKDESLGKYEDTLAYFQSLNIWKMSNELPNAAFYTQFSNQEGKQDWLAMMKRYVNFTNHSKLSKPQLLQFDNPLLIKAFYRNVGSDVEKVLFQEVYPEHTKDIHTAEQYVSELLIQGIYS